WEQPGPVLGRTRGARVIVWDALTGKSTCKIPKGGPPLAFSPDGHSLAIRKDIVQTVDNLVVDVRATVEIVDTHTGEGRLVPRDESNFAPSAVAFSPDGSLLAVIQPPKIELREAATGKNLHVLTGHKVYIDAVVFSPDGSLLLSGDEGGCIKLWDVGRGTGITTYYGPAAIRSLAFAPDGRHFLSGG